MQSNREYLEFDLSFLDEAKSPLAQTQAASAYKVNWHNIAVVAGIVVGIVFYICITRLPFVESHCDIKGSDVVVGINWATHGARVGVPSPKGQVEGYGEYTDEPNGDKRITVQDSVMLVSGLPGKSVFALGGNPPVTLNTTCGEFRSVSFIPNW
jgi:hypothetical protein